MPAKWLPPDELGERVRTLRSRLGVSQEELGEQCGLTKGQPAISRLERGEWDGQEPNANLLAKIAELGGETLAYFKAGEPSRDEREEKLIAAAWMEKLAKELRDEATQRPSPTAADLGVGKALQDADGEKGRRARGGSRS